MSLFHSWRLPLKKELLNILACPNCSTELQLNIFSEEKHQISEINEGTLNCISCSKIFPIIQGIPRFVPNILNLYPEFVNKYPQIISHEQLNTFKQLHGATQERFSYEWMRYPGSLDEDRPIFLNETQLEPSEWKDKWVLDGGCGMGRYSRVAHQLGATVVAMDIGTALIRLEDLAKTSSRMHIVQGDLTCPPFKKQVFDIIYSIGVIHHTPSAKKTFEQLTQFVKLGGFLTLWVYGAPGLFKNFKTNPLRKGREYLRQYIFIVWTIVTLREFISDSFRLVTIHLPHHLLYLLCYPLAFLGKFPLIKYLTFSVHPLWRVRLQENFDWLTPPYQSHHTKEELAEWFIKHHFKILKTLPHGFVPKPGILGQKIK